MFQNQTGRQLNAAHEVSLIPLNSKLKLGILYA